MLLERKLQRWVEAGLITESVKSDIVNFENRNSRNNILFTVLAIGAFSILVGIISIVASNWYILSKSVKLISAFTWLILLAVGIFFAVKKDRKIVAEVFIFIFFGSILGLIALIGQLYHLESHPYKALSLWLLIGTPIILFSKSIYNAHIWGMAISLLSFTAVDYFFELFKPTGSLYISYVPLGLFYVAILVYYLKLSNRHFFEALKKYALLVFTFVCLFIGSLRWTDALSEVNVVQSMIILMFFLPVILFVRQKYSPLHAGVFTLIISFLEAPNLFYHGDLKEFGAFYFLICCIALAYLGIHSNNRKLFEFSCLLIALRIIVIYFEIFGSLLETGIGLVSSGVFILFVAYFWHSRRDKVWGIKKT